MQATKPRFRLAARSPIVRRLRFENRREAQLLSEVLHRGSHAIPAFHFGIAWLVKSMVPGLWGGWDQEEDGPGFKANARGVFVRFGLQSRACSPRLPQQTPRPCGRQNFEDGFASLSGQLGGTVRHGWVSGK